MEKEEEIYGRILELIDEFRALSEIPEGASYPSPTPSDLEVKLRELEKFCEAFKMATTEAVIEAGETPEHLQEVAEEIPATLPPGTQRVLERAKELKQQVEDQALTLSLAYDLIKERQADSIDSGPVEKGSQLKSKGKLMRKKGWRPMR